MEVLKFLFPSRERWEQEMEEAISSRSKNEPVDQHHKFKMSQGICQDCQNGNYVCHRSAKGQEIQTGNTGQRGSENELDPVINPFPASAYVPGSHRKGKCIKGNRRDIYNNGRCADEQKRRMGSASVSDSSGEKYRRFFMVRQDDAKRTIKATRTERLMMQKHKEDREKKTFSPAFVYRSLDV